MGSGGGVNAECGNPALPCAGFVIDPRTGEPTPDDSRVVVLDGLLREHERAGLLAWLTAPGWDHAAGPPEAKWARACVDREGDAATWGLRCVV